MRYRSITQHKHDDILIKIISQHKMNSSRKISSSAQHAVKITHLHNKPIRTPSSSPGIRTGFHHQKPQLHKLTPHDPLNCTKVTGTALDATTHQNIFPVKISPTNLDPTFNLSHSIRCQSHALSTELQLPKFTKLSV